MFDLYSTNKNELDFFRELENIGVSHAATALSVMLDRKISIRVPNVQFCTYQKICDILNGPENVVAGLLVGISGDMDGFILLVLDQDDAYTLTRTLLDNTDCGKSSDDLSEMQISALKEVANILIGSYVTAISKLTGLKIDVSIPDLVIDMSSAIMNLLAAAYGEYDDTVLFLETEFIDQSSSLFGHFFLIPDINSYNKLIHKMGIC